MIKNKRKIIFAAAIVAALAGGSVAVFAAVNTFASIKSMISTGGVKIDISAYTEEQGRTVPLTEKTSVDCNGSASYIPTIVNNGESCYVRVRLAADTDIQQIDILKALKDVKSNWKAINGYLYYMKPLKHKEKTEVCKGFDVPHDWDYMADNEMNIKVTADAIQAENLIPDFDSEHPWGDVEILESHIKNDYTVNTVSPADIKTDDIKIDSDGFFENIRFMPGDKCSDSLKFINRGEKSIAVMMKTEFKEGPLPCIIQVKISNGDPVYEGSLAGSKFKGYGEILYLKPGESEKINVELSMPEWADNRYQTSVDQIVWHFAAKADNNAVKTGDAMPLWILSILCFAGASVFLMVYRRCKGENI